MTLFWYIHTITQYILVCTGLYYCTFPVLVCTRYVLVCTGSEPVHTKYPVPVIHFTIPDGFLLPGAAARGVAARQSAELPLHLWPTRIPGQKGPGHPVRPGIGQLTVT